MSLDLLKKYLQEKGLSFSCAQEMQLERFRELLSEANKVMNLTAVRDGKETEIRHFIDSLALLAELPGKHPVVEDLFGSRVIDLGTGAGFPGIPLAVMLPDTNFTLVDSLHKRISFLERVVSDLSLQNVSLVCGRFEELARDPEYRESFDLGVSRAVADMRVLLEYSLPFIKGGGSFAAYKSSSALTEIDSSHKALEELSAEVEGFHEYFEYGSDVRRCIVVIHKNGPMSDRYPRRNGIPLKRPL